MSSLSKFKFPEFIKDNYFSETLVNITEDSIIDTITELYFKDGKIYMELIHSNIVFEILDTSFKKGSKCTKGNMYTYEYELDIKDNGPIFILDIDGEEYKTKLESVYVSGTIHIVFEIMN